MPWRCPKCERVLRNQNAVHSCIKKDLDALFKNKNEKLLLLFEKILAGIYDWENVHISATEKCIVCLSHQTFLVIKPMKTQLNIKFYLDYENDEFPIYKVSKYGRNFEHHIRVSEFEDVNNQLMSFIRASYNHLTAK